MIPISSIVSDQRQLVRYIPNLVFAADGEDDLYDKIHTSIQAMRSFLECRLTGSLVPECLADKVGAIIALEAFALAAPQLDLVITPNGFGVVSTSDTAPASKDRVDRLIAMLHVSADKITDQVIQALLLDEQWRSSPVSRIFSMSMFYQLSAVKLWCRPDESSLECLERIANIAFHFQAAAAEFMIGVSCMELMTAAFHGIEPEVNTDDMNILHRAAAMFFPKLCAWVDRVQDADFIPDPSEQYMWQSLRLVTKMLMRSPTLALLVREESTLNANQQSVISSKGALYL